MNIDDEAIKVLSSCIIQAIKDITPAFSDLTVQGRIVEILENNRFNVEIQGTEYTSVPSCSDIVFIATETVWVQLPQGKWDNMFILGRRVVD